METGPLTPCAHDVILGNRKDDVAIGVVFDLRERTLVSREKDGSHVGRGCGGGDLGRGGGGEADLWNFTTESAHNADGVEVGCRLALAGFGQRPASALWATIFDSSRTHLVRGRAVMCHSKLVSHK